MHTYILKYIIIMLIIFKFIIINMIMIYKIIIIHMIMRYNNMYVCVLREIVLMARAVAAVCYITHSQLLISDSFDDDVSSYLYMRTYIYVYIYEIGRAHV